MADHLAREQMALRLPAAIATQMRHDMEGVSEQVIAAVISEVPSYRDPFRGRMGRNIEVAVKVALDGFLDLASRREGIDAGEQVEAVLEAAYALGRGEARSGRSMDALAQAYRVGARVAWREMSSAAVNNGLAATMLARLAELVFAYIDELSDASVSGHADELATSGRLRQRRLDRLTTRLIEGASESELAAAAERADWEPPASLTAVVLPESKVRSVRGLLDPRTLFLADDASTVDLASGSVVLLVPAAAGRSRTVLLRVLADATAVVGPARPWTQARSSYLRVAQAHQLGLTGDTDLHLARVVLNADTDALADLRARVLAPLDAVSATSRTKLTETLNAWLLHQGRRDDIAGALFVHPQTVRYRMGQLRDLYGDRLTDPEFVRDATIALGESAVATSA
ncbi:PucR family transcriptional regulator [Nocardioides marmoriginsengisoli]|uniref:PucR family transcriptional regulator n=1 Tax=Nocardioides marmoriginsengisoli TaxID=661483 RepID=A0A3N0CC41_9ACTN|nr:PucR family transcriptional regulator [Nocardioides marmoriginsengisoli]RNL60636.1 PucR family transcriptional regulator [Nocardioides marmoriginsengisoli]